jgi:hypothetical protein
MSTFMKRLKHAFAVEADYDVSSRGLPSGLEKIAREVVDRGMETPAIILLESMVPLSFLGSQALFAAWPLVKMAADGSDYREVARALEDRRTLRLMADRIEELAASGGAR